MKKKDQIFVADFPIPKTESVEKQLISELIISPDSIRIARAIVKEEHFYDPKRAKAYGALCAMDEAGEPIDYSTLGEKIGLDYVISEFLSSDMATERTIEKHCYVLLEGYIKRQAYFTAVRLLQQTARPEAEVWQTVAMIDDFKGLITNATSNESTVTLSKAIGEFEESLLGNDNHIISGFPLLDDLTYGGFDAGQLIVLAARPSVGKTAVALYMALCAAKTGKKAHIYSIEMTKEELAKRYIFADGAISPYDIARGTLNWEEFARIKGEYTKYPIYINDRLNTVDGIVSEIMAQHRANNLDIAFIDYLQLVKDISQMTEGKANFIGMVTSRLKEMAKTLGIPIVVLSQLNRRSVMDGSRRPPVLADLRDSGSIEQDADTVLMLEPCFSEDFETNDDAPQINMWVRKNRGGRRDVAIKIETNSTHTTYKEISLITE